MKKEVKPYIADKPRIYIVDVTNRDGVQTSRLGLAKLEKTIINIMLRDVGVYQSEFGFPTTHHETNYLKGNLKLAEQGVLNPIVLEGWIRAISQDVELAYQLVPEIEHLNLSISTSKQMTQGKFQGKKTREDILAMMTEAVDAAIEYTTKTIGVNAEDASRTDDRYLIKFALAAKEHGADRIRYCDTLGRDDPLTVYKRVNLLAKEVGIPVELHCHNDLGMVVATSLIGALGAIDAGVDAYINTTINGMGERTGNCDLVSVLLAAKYSSIIKEKYPDVLDPKIDLKNAYRIAKYASHAFGVPIPVNQVGVGANAFAHESGIHADGALKDRKNYELYPFEELGRGEPEFVETGRLITTGEYSGIKGFMHVMGQYDVKFDDEKQARWILELVRYANVHKQKPVTGEELLFIYQHPEIAAQIMTVTPPNNNGNY